jgi:hypothetical protein
MWIPEPFRDEGRTAMAVGSLAPDTGRYQHLACTKTEIFSKGDLRSLCQSKLSQQRR